MKTRMMIGIALAALLLTAQSVEAQSRVARRTRTERRDERRDQRRDEKLVRQPDPRRTQPVAVLERRVPVLKVVDNDVIRAFDRERFDSDRLKMADMIFSTGGLMTVDQIVKISEIFDYDTNRIKFLKKAYDNCVDRHNFYLVLGTLDYSSSRDKMMKYVLDNRIDEIRDGEPYRKVTNSDMNAIIKALKKESFDNARGKLAEMIVCGNLLTSRQIADMAKTFSFDSNRYDFLLTAYRSCVDPQNYVVAANTLEFSTNRNDLMRKITRKP